MYPNLKLQLWRCGIRQNRLAKMMGMDESVLSRIVNGFRDPSEDIRRQIAALLGTDEHWLFDASGEQATQFGPRDDVREQERG